MQYLEIKIINIRNAYHVFSYICYKRTTYLSSVVSVIKKDVSMYKPLNCSKYKFRHLIKSCESITSKCSRH